MPDNNSRAAFSIHRAKVKRLVDWKAPVTTRPFWRIYWNSSRGALIRHKNIVYEPDKNNILVIPPNTGVEQTLIAPFESFYVHFSLGAPYDRFHGEVFTVKVDEEIEAALKKAFKLTQADARFFPEKIFCLSAYLAAIMSKLPESFWSNQVNDDRICRTIELMEIAPERHRSNSELARTAGLSLNAYVRLFHEKTGFPPQGYLLRLRLSKASMLLLDSNASIDEIAHECGFCDRYYFSKLFKREFMTTPAAYRKLNIY